MNDDGPVVGEWKTKTDDEVKAQVLDDLALLSALREREAEREQAELEELAQDYVGPEDAYRPLNRAERRNMVAEFKRNLRLLPRAVPARNATIIPKAKRRHK